MKQLPFLILIVALTAFKASYTQQPYQPYRTNNNITLDGNMDEAEWQLTPVETDFMQTGPDPGATPTERTEVRVMYNDEYLFVAMTCYDSEPDKLVRLELERDFPIGQEDGVSFTVDTYHDNISGLVFVTNTLNARWDAQATRDGSGLSDSYNTYWDTRTTLQPFGFTTEFRIPFSSLRFEQKPLVIMGFRVARLIKRKNELITYPKCDPSTNDAWTNISYAREIEFHDLKARNPFYISPYAIANYYEENVLNDAGTAYEKNAQFMTRKNFVDNETLDKIISNIGVDAKYGLSKNLTLDLTLNTDFAQAEVDDRIINLSKYDVNLPEKRSFFLESANQLSFGFPSGNELFITRKIGKEDGLIVPIVGGARLTGKVGRWQIGALNMQTTGITSTSIAPHNFSVVRTRRDIDSLGSFIGGIICNKINTDSTSGSNQSFGLDFVKRVNPQFSVEGGAAATAMDFKMDSLIQSGYLHLGMFKSAVTGLTYSTLFDFVGPSTNFEMGYLDENNYGKFSGKIGYQWYLKNSNHIKYVYINSNEAYRYKMNNGGRETFSISLMPGISFNNGAEISVTVFDYTIDSLFYDWELDDHNAISSGVYKMLTNSISLVSPQQSNYTASLYASYGDFYGGKRVFINPDATYYFGKHLNMSLTYEYNHIAFDKYLLIDSSTIYATNLLRLGIAYNFSTRVSLKAYVQFDDQSHQTSSNIRFRYNPTEGTDLFIVLNQGLNNTRDRLDPKLPSISNQAVTVKFIKTFGG